MERIHLEKDSLPRFAFFRLRHTILLKRAKFKACRRSKSQRSLRIAHDNSSLSLQPTIPATFLFPWSNVVFEGRGSQNWCEIIFDIEVYVKISVAFKTENPFGSNHNEKAMLDNLWSFPLPLFPMIWRHACCSMRACVMRAGTWIWISVMTSHAWLTWFRLDSAPAPRRTGMVRSVEKGGEYMKGEKVLLQKWREYTCYSWVLHCFLECSIVCFRTYCSL